MLKVLIVQPDTQDPSPPRTPADPPVPAAVDIRARTPAAVIPRPLRPAAPRLPEAAALQNRRTSESPRDTATPRFQTSPRADSAAVLRGPLTLVPARSR